MPLKKRGLWTLGVYVIGMAVGCATSQSQLDPPSVVSSSSAEDRSPGLGPVIYWNLPTGWSVLADLPSVPPLPNGFIEPRPAPPWFREALGGGHFFSRFGPDRMCVQWNVRHRRAQTSFFENGQRTIRHIYELEAEDEAIHVLSREQRRAMLHVRQLRFELSGPDVEERQASGLVSQAESLRDIQPYSVVGGDSRTAVTVQSFGMVRAYDPTRTVLWFRDREQCERSPLAP